jgi:hypothetical protein
MQNCSRRSAAWYGPRCFSQAKLVEKVTRKGNELIIPTKNMFCPTVLP